MGVDVLIAPQKYCLREFVNASGVSPFREWLVHQPVAVRARIQARLLRFESGNIGDSRLVGDGVFEARFHFGSGYRVYFVIEDKTIILLLLGGDKKSQSADIKKAKQNLRQYLESE